MDRAARCMKAAPGHGGVQDEPIPDRKETAARGTGKPPQGSCERTPARIEYTETVRLLLDQGADVHAQNEAALRWAASNGHAETVRLLQDRDGDVHKALRSAMANANQPTATALRETIQNQNEATQNQNQPSSPKPPAPPKL